MPFLRIWFATRFQRHHPIENIRSRQLVSYPCILLSMMVQIKIELASLALGSLARACYAWFIGVRRGTCGGRGVTPCAVTSQLTDVIPKLVLSIGS